MDTPAATVVPSLWQTLATNTNPDGGWGYFAGKASRLEPTSWAILTLADTRGPIPPARLSASLALVRKWQQRDGLLADVPGAPPNFAFNGLAAVIIRRVAELWPAAMANLTGIEQRLLDGLLAAKGVRLKGTAHQRQDNQLQGWPWIDGTFSWIEPTAWCLLALKKARRILSDRRYSARIDEAALVLADRRCEAGGWNYGTSNISGKEYSPFVPTTALALLALQDRRYEPEMQNSLAWFGDNRGHESTGMALALALITSQVLRLPVTALEERLAKQAVQTGFFGNLSTTAMALYALTRSQDGAAAFVV